MESEQVDLSALRIHRPENRRTVLRKAAGLHNKHCRSCCIIAAEFTAEKNFLHRILRSN